MAPGGLSYEGRRAVAMKGVLRSSESSPSAPSAIRPAPGPTSSSTRRAASARATAVPDEVGQPLRRQLHQDPLAHSRQGDADPRRAVGAGADHRRVAHAAGIALAGAAGRGGGGELAPGVEGHAADGAQPRVLGLPGRGHRRVVEAPARLVEVLLPVGDLGRRRDDAHRLAEPRREGEGLGTGEHDVRVLLEEVAREAHGVREERHLRHRAGPTVARHDARVEARDAVGLQVGAGAGVEQRLVLERAHRRLGRVEGAAALLQDVPAGVGRALAGRVARPLLAGGRRAAPAVHDERRRSARFARETHGRSRAHVGETIAEEAARVPACAAAGVSSKLGRENWRPHR